MKTQTNQTTKHTAGNSLQLQPCGDCDPCLGGRTDQCALFPSPYKRTEGMSLDLKTLITDKLNQGVPESVFANAPDLIRQRDELASALKELMRCFVGDRNSQNCIGESGIAADQARAALASISMEGEAK